MDDSLLCCAIMILIKLYIPFWLPESILVSLTPDVLLSVRNPHVRGAKRTGAEIDMGILQSFSGTLISIWQDLKCSNPPRTPSQQTINMSSV